MLQPLMLTVKETVRRSGMPENAVRRWVKEGKVHYVKSGNRFYIAWSSVVSFLNGSEDTMEV